MNRDQFWSLIAEARVGLADPNADNIAQSASAILVRRPAAEIVRAAQPLWDLMAESYRAELWAAAYLINGGASDDGFEYFRGWLIGQGREVFDQAVADPDALAGMPAVMAAAEKGEDLDGEPVLGIAWNAYRQKTGEQLPAEAFTINYPPITFGWDFEDTQQMRRHLPRLSHLYLE
ncbi:DUF4240 domain-containing protein [Actinomadura litoris]|uniref:DUF4240 domain-containing protein n=1 Tax=Actinomadura litoris TaxID=2678616 RepID=UPI001FA6D407|nr:DUF4240 domain-containing protein [Actinomadura litoris]